MHDASIFAAIQRTFSPKMGSPGGGYGSLGDPAKKRLSLEGASNGAEGGVVTGLGDLSGPAQVLALSIKDPKNIQEENGGGGGDRNEGLPLLSHEADGKSTEESKGRVSSWMPRMFK